MTGKNLLVTGAAGLIGSEAVRHFSALGWTVHGVDNNMRADFFGADGDTTWNLHRLQAEIPRYVHHALDIRDRARVKQLFCERQPEVVFHAAALKHLPLLEAHPIEALKSNMWGTLSVLEASAAAGVSTRNFVATPGLTVIGGLVPLIGADTVSVAVTVQLPVVFSVAPSGNACTPASVPVNV